MKSLPPYPTSARPRVLRWTSSYRQQVAALGLALGLMASPVAAVAAEARVVVVNVARLLADSPSARAVATKIEQEFAPRRQRVQAQLRQLREMSEKFAKDAPTLGEREHLLRERAVGELEREVRRSQAQIGEDFAERNAAERDALARRIHDIVLVLPSQLGVDVVLTRTLWHRPSIDVTDKVGPLLEK